MQRRGQRATEHAECCEQLGLVGVLHEQRDRSEALLQQHRGAGGDGPGIGEQHDGLRSIRLLVDRAGDDRD